MAQPIDALVAAIVKQRDMYHRLLEEAYAELEQLHSALKTARETHHRELHAAHEALRNAETQADGTRQQLAALHNEHGALRRELAETQRELQLRASEAAKAVSNAELKQRIATLHDLIAELAKQRAASSARSTELGQLSLRCAQLQ